ncbi:hypothetical protein pb186bvf_014320 [Paramecium bursaria]
MVNQCFDRGLFDDGSCYCDIGYSGSTCEIWLAEDHQGPYYCYIGLFAALFLILFIISINQISGSLQSNKIPSYYKGIKYLYQMLLSPKNFILGLTILFCILRLFWIITDPFQIFVICIFIQDFEQMVYQRLIAEIPYTLLFFIYGILLIVWYTMYDEISFNIQAKDKFGLNDPTLNLSPQTTLNKQQEQISKRPWIFRYYKDFMKLRLILVLAIQVTVSTLNGLRLNKKYANYMFLFYGLLLINFLSFIVEFLVYGSNLRGCIQQQLDLYKEQISVKTLKEEQLASSNMSAERQGLNSPNSAQVLGSPQFNSRRLSSHNNPLRPLTKKRSITIAQDVVIESPHQEDVINKKKSGFQKRASGFGTTTLKRGPSMQTNFRNESQTVLQQPSKTIEEEEENNNNSIIIEEQIKKQKTQESCVLDEKVQFQNWDVSTQKQIIEEVYNNQIKIIKTAKEQYKQMQVSAISRDSKTPTIPVKYADLEFQNEMQQELKKSKKQNLTTDGKVLNKIQLLVQLGVILEILFGVLSVLILSTDILQSAVGTLCYLYISSLLQFLSLITVLKLFKDVRSKEILNLIWIQKKQDKPTLYICNTRGIQG